MIEDQNIWVMKSVLKLFELTSGLKINFSKSSLYGLNTDDGFLLRYSNYLCCKLSLDSFTYLGIPMGDIGLFGSKRSVGPHWFRGGLVRRIGNGSSTSYKCLFNLSVLKDGLVSDFGKWVGGKWEWVITWRRELFSWEIVLSNSFLKVLLDCTLQYNKPDSWEWKHDKSKHYAKSKAPLKVLTFVWRLFQDKIHTKEALLKRGITLHDGGGSLCVFCNKYPESATHLFSTCSISYSVWQHIYRWLNICVVLPFFSYTYYSLFLGLVKTRKG
ncbi:hypothetical protein Lal_00025987 [Lupinus albus]|nr:hypothetical protein Lal_00025987 [Lupinus albus]